MVYPKLNLHCVSYSPVASLYVFLLFAPEYMSHERVILSDVKQPNTLTTELHRSSCQSPVPVQKHVLICIIWMELYCWFITFLGIYFKLICEHCKFEQMNKTFCDRTHVNRILFIFAVVNFDWVFCLSCATWLRAKWSWWLDFIGNSVIHIHNLKLLNTKL